MRKNLLKVMSVSLLLIAICVVFSGCEKRLTEGQIIDDVTEAIQNQIESYAPIENPSIKSVSIIKRSADEINKDDNVYLCVEFENDFWSLKYNYQAQFHLFDEGWKLDRIRAYSNNIAGIVNEIKAKAPDENEIRKSIENYMLDQYEHGKATGGMAYSWAGANNVTFNLEQTEFTAETNSGHCTYNVTVRFDYDHYTVSNVVFPAEFSYSTEEPKWTYDIDKSIFVGSASDCDKNAVISLNETMQGMWEGAMRPGQDPIQIVFDSVEEDGYLLIKSYYDKYNFSAQDIRLRLCDSSSRYYYGRFTFVLDRGDEPNLLVTICGSSTDDSIQVNYSDDHIYSAFLKKVK